MRTPSSLSCRAKHLGGVAFAGSVLLATLSVPARVQAYRTFADDPDVRVAVRHRSDLVRWDIVRAPHDEAVASAANAAFDVWTTPACTGLRHELVGVTGFPAAAGDGRNTIEIVYTGWEERGFPAGRAASVDVQTSLVDTEAGRQGEISEADLYLNLEQYGFGLPGTDRVDLSLVYVLTHELGHFAVGLLHPCETDASDAPSCPDVVDARQSVMYPEYLESAVPVLSEQDQAALCSLYPATGCPVSCGIARVCESDACVACTDASCTTTACRGPECSPEPGVPCSSAVSCAAGVCARFGRGVGECVLSGALGADCTVPTQCDSNLCLVRTRPEVGDGYCSRRCESSAECLGPAQVCSERGVCEPRPGAASCDVSRHRGASGAPGIWLLAGCASLLCIARRRKS